MNPSSTAPTTKVLLHHSCKVGPKEIWESHLLIPVLPQTLSMVLRWTEHDAPTKRLQGGPARTIAFGNSLRRMMENLWAYNIQIDYQRLPENNRKVM